jgi:hypothetical protein
MKTQTELPDGFDKRLFLREREVEDIFGIKASTLRRQRTGNYGFPFTVVGRPKNTNKGGIIFYSVKDIEAGKWKHNCKLKGKNFNDT